MGDAMTREDIATERALKMHDLALSVVRSRGLTRLEGSTTVLEYRYGILNIQYRSGHGQLDVWFMRRVLSVERFARQAAAHALHAGTLGASSDRGGEGGRVKGAA
jgi:predicted nucleic acid-binding protein